MRKWLSRLFVLLVIFLFLQLPFFMMQYIHHLEGHLEELRLFRQELVTIAEKNHLLLDNYVAHFENSSDKVISSQGLFMQSRLDRFEEFSKALTAYKDASPWQRPFVFLRYLDKGVGKETLSSFEMGFNLGLESLCYAAVGFIVGILIFNPFKRRSKNDNISGKSSDT